MDLGIYNSKLKELYKFDKDVDRNFIKSLSPDAILSFNRLDRQGKKMGTAYVIGGFFSNNYRHWKNLGEDATSTFFLFRVANDDDEGPNLSVLARWNKNRNTKTVKEIVASEKKNGLLAIMEAEGEPQLYVHIDPKTQGVDGILINDNVFFAGEEIGTPIVLTTLPRIDLNSDTLPAAAVKPTRKTGYKDGLLTYVAHFYFPKADDEEEAESFELSGKEAEELGKQVYEGINFDNDYPEMKVLVINSTKEVIFTYPAELKPDQVKETLSDIQGGLTDGFGENGFTLTHKGKEYLIFVD